MAVMWYKKASVQSALVSTVIGTVPAAIIAVASIYIQKDLAEKQLRQQFYIDSIQSIESDKESLNAMLRFKSDSLLAIKQLELNQLQLTASYERQHFETIFSKNMEALNKQALDVSKKQYGINQKSDRERRNNNISKLWLTLKDIESFTLEGDVQYNLDSPHGIVNWVNKASILIENPIQNPVLLENPILLKDWTNQIDELRTNRWFFTVLGIAEGDSIGQATKKPNGSMLIYDSKVLSSLIIRSKEFHTKLLQSI